MEWPAEPFWDYSLALYRQPAVEAACLDLQRRHGLDVNLLLLCCWLASRGVPVGCSEVTRLEARVQDWHAEVVRPLRALRQRLRVRLAGGLPEGVAAAWPQLAGTLRESILALELDAEHVEQLELARCTAGLAPGERPGIELAAGNLAGYRGFDEQDRSALEALLLAAFPGSGEGEVAAALSRLVDEEPARC
jgi:uncharacterized protein (TIGR02444 family)